MKLLPFALLLSSIGMAAAQTAHFTDPANLRGERVKPRDGRELPIDGGNGQAALGLQQMLRKLNTRASLMLIIAHPDDEDGGMLTFYSRGLGARVAMLTLTRGEGGQNAMTGDFEDALGLLRTQELLSADRYLGVDQMFGTEVDFGFSKTKEEAFSKWTHERVLYDAVRAVRLYRPLVIASVFIGGVTDGHGHHQVSGQIAQEVFKAAGDPKVFPELTAQGILPWQPLKVYARVPLGAITEQGLFDYATGQYAPARFTNYVTGEVSTAIPSADVVIHEGQPDVLLADEKGSPRSFVQFARLGLGLQRSQIGPGVRAARAGTFDIAYHLYGTSLPPSQNGGHESSFFDGIDTSLQSLAPANAPTRLRDDLQQLSSDLSEAAAHFVRAQPSAIAPLLASALSRTDSLLSFVQAGVDNPQDQANLLHELTVKRVQLNQALALSLGLTLDATVHGSEQTAGALPVVATDLRAGSAASLDVSREWLENALGATRESETTRERTPEVSAEHPFTRTFRTNSAVQAGSDLSEHAFTEALSRPYFDRADVEAPVYHLRVAALRNAPASPPALTAWATVSYKGVPVTVGRIVHDGSQPLSFVPAVSLALDHHAEALPASAVSVGLSVQVRGTAPGKLRLLAPPGWMLHPAVQPLAPNIGAGPVHFEAVPPKNAYAGALLSAHADSQSGEIYTEGYRSIGYGDLPRTQYFEPATDHIVPVDLKLPAHNRLAYLPGTGDAVPESLASIGVRPTMLTVADLNAAKLAQFDTVVLGVRTYNAHPDLHGAPTQALFDFARNGGNVVVQYQTAEFTGADAPFPLTLGNAEKVVDETAPVAMLDPAAPALSTPNKLTAADFGGWIEERGHGFLRSWSDQYTALTETHDPGSASEGVGPQAPQRGGLITVQLGKGHWTYCAFALYRQLPEAVPGAYRLFTNLLALADQR